MIHSPSGVLAKPAVENASMLPMIGVAPVKIVNAAQLPGEIHAFLMQGDAPHTVEVPVLASLLQSML